MFFVKNIFKYLKLQKRKDRQAFIFFVSLYLSVQVFSKVQECDATKASFIFNSWVPNLLHLAFRPFI